MMERHVVPPGSKVDLEKWDAACTKAFPDGKEAAEEKLLECKKRIFDLQEKLYADRRFKVLIILQGMDTAGKDGVIRHVFEGVNPQGVRVASFKKPSEEELEHDYLWRVHKQAPRSGEIAIFNRSHYEDVLVVRVHGLVPEKRWRRRYRHINEFERMLADEGCAILKFFLHISKDEQARRLQKRVASPDKQWKLSASDIPERKLWDRYMEAYGEMLSETSTEHAPWTVVPSNKKWYQRLVVSLALRRALEKMELRYPKPSVDVSTLAIPD